MDKDKKNITQPQENKTNVVGTSFGFTPAYQMVGAEYFPRRNFLSNMVLNPRTYIKKFKEGGFIFEKKKFYSFSFPNNHFVCHFETSPRTYEIENLLMRIPFVSGSENSDTNIQ